uniref:Putative secreted protein n=1 Tax=Anopheles darlingi TaxID=43151 RepID=A0A2M4D3C8_ANODA
MSCDHPLLLTILLNICCLVFAFDCVTLSLSSPGLLASLLNSWTILAYVQLTVRRHDEIVWGGLLHR